MVYVKTKATTMQLAKAIASILKQHNYETYIVGGTVRDMLLMRPAKDLDMATNAKPDVIIEIFRKACAHVIETGMKHGTVTVILNGEEPVEITTYRKDGEYTDGRHPDSVEFVTNLYDDLARRDFTVNAIAINPYTEEIEDPFGGIDDLNKRFIRAVGNPQDRFNEDGLRALRAARFAAQLGFTIERDTFEAMKTDSTKKVFAKVSAERVRDELLKGLGSNLPGVFVTFLESSGLLYEIFPELREAKGLKQPAKYHKFDVLYHSINVMMNMAAFTPDPFLRLVALLHDIGKPVTLAYKEDGRPTFPKHDVAGSHIIEKIMRRLKITAEQIEAARKLVLNHLVFYNKDWTDPQIRRWVNKVGPELIDAQIKLAQADIIGTGIPERAIEAEAYIELMHRLTMMNKPSITVRDLALNGHDFMALGLKGKQIGDAQKYLLEKIIEDPDLNTKETLIKLLGERP